MNHDFVPTPEIKNGHKSLKIALKALTTRLLNVIFNFRQGQTAVKEAVSSFILKISAFYCRNIVKNVILYQNLEEKVSIKV